jgi:hypothetical protein
MTPDLIFPDAKSFADIFESANRYNHATPLDGRLEWLMIGNTGPIVGKHTAGNVITSYCCIQSTPHRGSMHVRPKPEVIEFIRRHMIQVDYDHIFFNIVIRDDGTALITVSYNQILGSYWLALVDIATVPQPELTASQFAELTRRKVNHA